MSGPKVDAILRPRLAEERSELARQVTENPIFQQAREDMRGELIAAWLGTNEDVAGTTERDKREVAWRNVRFLDHFVNTLNGYIQRAAVKRASLP